MTARLNFMSKPLTGLKRSLKLYQRSSRKKLPSLKATAIRVDILQHLQVLLVHPARDLPDAVYDGPHDFVDDDGVVYQHRFKARPFDR